jgi:DNA-binding NtrC family response regulator
LIVDDDELVLDALRRQLHSRFDVCTVTGGKEALNKVVSEGPFAAVISDLRMPGMDGVTLLYLVRKAAPHTVRILLSGKTDVAAASAAVNDASVFLLLSKPCPTGTLLRALDAAVAEHRLATKG